MNISFTTQDSCFTKMFNMQKTTRKKLSAADKFFVPDTQYMYLIHKGLLKLYVSNSDGDERLMWLMGEGSIISTFHSNEELSKRIQIVKDTELLVMEKSEFIKAVSKEESLFLCFTQQIYGRYESLIQNFINDSNEFTKMRFYELIYEIAGMSERQFMAGILLDNYLSRQDMASLIGTHVTNISKYLLEMEKQGLIRRLKGKEILVLDLEELEAEIERMEMEQEI